MSSARNAIRVAWALVRVVLRSVSGKVLVGLFDSRENEQGPYEMWTAAAQACGVENLVGKRPTFLKPRRIEGARPPLTVTIAPFPPAGSANAIVTIRGVSGAIRLRHDTLRAQASKLAGARDVLIGDPEFDAEFFVAGDTLTLHAVFDARARELALRVFGRRPSVARELLAGDDHADLGIEDGALVVRLVDEGYPYPPASPSEALGEVLALAERLDDGRLEERLAAIARRDPVAAVRLAAIATLRDERPRHPSTRDALEAACTDADAHIRLVAATAAGMVKGKSTLLDLASMVRGPDDVSARAVGELRSHLPADQARSILAAALRARRLATAAACIDTLSRSGSHADVIARVLALEGGGLGRAAAKALGRCGSLDDVPLLRKVESRHARDGELPRACRSAIAAIHSRQPGAPGRLSLAADQAGRVSLARDEEGRLSLGPRGDETSG